MSNKFMTVDDVDGDEDDELDDMINELDEF